MIFFSEMLRSFKIEDATRNKTQKKMKLQKLKTGKESKTSFFCFKILKKKIFQFFSLIGRQTAKTKHSDPRVRTSDGPSLPDSTSAAKTWACRIFFNAFKDSPNSLLSSDLSRQIFDQKISNSFNAPLRRKANSWSKKYDGSSSSS